VTGAALNCGLVMLSRWLGGLTAAAAALVACVLVILDLTDAGLRRWWDAHALTTDTIAGLLVLMITVLVVDQVVRLRQGNSRALVAGPDVSQFLILLSDLVNPGRPRVGDRSVRCQEASPNVARI
jgi:hypothetical protein